MQKLSKFDTIELYIVVTERTKTIFRETKTMEIQNLKDQLKALIDDRKRTAESGLDTSFQDATIREVQAHIDVLESQQARDQVQEEEVQAITLPYDFNELFSEEGHIITNANEMIIEVVKDTKRQANIEKNQALDEQKAEYQSMLLSAGGREHQLQEEINIVQTNHLEDIRLREESDRKLSQAILERDDAFNKRDAAFRQLEEANETIRGLKTKLENVPAATQSFDISPSDKLAQMVKESLDEKVARGLDRWKDIIPVQTAKIEAVTPFTGQDEATTDKSPIEEELRTAAFGLAEESSNGDREVVEESQIDLDIEVVFTLEYVRQLRILEEKVALIESKLVA